jgi:hypothetical protein
MGNFDRLQRHVAKGDLRIVNVEAIPRSVSTAFCRALNETADPSVYVNEPFNRMRHDIDEASGHVLDASLPLLDSADRQVVVITKNMARNISSDNSRRWTEISSGFAWSVRDPLVQIGSLLTRVANDIIVAPGADKISKQEVGPYIKQASDFLESSGVSSGFSKTSWADIGQHYRDTDNHEASIVVDGGELTTDSRTILGSACLKLGLGFSEAMVSDWGNGYVNANGGYSTSLADTENGWIKHAVSSTGIVPVEHTPITLAELPAALQDHITQVAVPTYEEMTGMSYNYPS